MVDYAKFAKAVEIALDVGIQTLAQRSILGLKLDIKSLEVVSPPKLPDGYTLECKEGDVCYMAVFDVISQKLWSVIVYLVAHHADNSYHQTFRFVSITLINGINQFHTGSVTPVEVAS